MSEVRLIDANALKEHKFLTPQVKVIGGRHNGKTKEQIVEAYQKGWNDCIDAIIDNAPTVVERPKGEWIETQRGIHVTDYKCSCCGRTVRDDTGYNVSKDYPFCNCGADMRGDENGKS